MTSEPPNQDFFKKFFREFRAGLRIQDQPVLDKLIDDLVEISKIIQPARSDGQYTFREILILIMLLNQERLQLLKK